MSIVVFASGCMYHVDGVMFFKQQKSKLKKIVGIAYIQDRVKGQA
jgi:hypothetical protein